MEKRRAILSLVLMAGGAALLMYGFFAHADEVWPADGPPTLSSVTVDSVVVEPIMVASIASEPAMIREVTIGGLKRDALGQLKKTYSGQAPKACPT